MRSNPVRQSCRSIAGTTLPERQEKSNQCPVGSGQESHGRTGQHESDDRNHEAITGFVISATERAYLHFRFR